jgi:hypothetical protein
MKSPLALAALLLAQTLPAHAAAPELPPIRIGDWTYAGMASRTLMFVRPEPGEPNARIVTVKVRFEEAAPFVRDGFAAMSNVEVDEVDCGRMRTRVIQNTLYAERNMMGEEHALPVREPEWRTEEKGSLGAGILDTVCGPPLEA